MISLIPLKTLTLKKSPTANSHLHLSAASGLVQLGSHVYVVADDENYLGKFILTDPDGGTLLRLFEGDLPLTFTERKAQKPDLEVLTLLPNSPRFPHGALLALGSGSKKNRNRGVILSLDLDQNIDNIERVDLTNFYQILTTKIGKLNVEGGVILDEDLLLFQRGNKKNKLNASIRLKLKDFYQCLYDPVAHQPFDVLTTQYNLGEINGVPLCFTDATALTTGDIVFTATAEDTSDGYNDGACLGSAIGIIGHSGALLSIELVDLAVKLEGVTATITGNDVNVLVVTDADNAEIPAQIYSASLIYPSS